MALYLSLLDLLTTHRFADDDSHAWTAEAISSQCDIGNHPLRSSTWNDDLGDSTPPSGECTRFDSNKFSIRL